MKTLYSSSFISIILAFLMFMGQNNQKVDVVTNPVIPDFSNILQIRPSESYDAVNVEIFDDLTCDKCDDFAKNTAPKIKNLEQETGKIALHLYFIPDINNEIYYMAAMSLKCAADQNKFWEMYQKLHENKNNLNKKIFYQFAKELEMNADLIQECIKEDAHRNEIETDIKYASEKNITFKPSVIVSEYYLIGNQPFENIQRIINKSIKKIEEDHVRQSQAHNTEMPAAVNNAQNVSSPDDVKIEAAEPADNTNPATTAPGAGI
jgi:protein-disulfide isomerase